MLKVEDSGPGIPDSEQDKVFNRFYRLDKAQPGSGLGLAIVRDIAIDHAASIEVSRVSDLGGTLFQVIFPAIDGLSARP